MTTSDQRRDEGAILPLVLVMTVVLSMVIVALASYVSAGLRFSHIVEERADRLAAADGGLRYGIERLGLQSYAGCFTALGNTGFAIPFPAPVNQSTVTVTCRKAGSGFSDIQGWAIVATGQDVPSGQWIVHSSGGAGKQKLLGGPVYVADPTRMDLQSPVEIEDGDLWYSSSNCDGTPPSVPPNLTFKPALRGLLCLPEPWDQLYTAPSVNVPTNAPDPPVTDGEGCTVFSPGKYTSAPAFGAHNYFKAGEYYFENVPLVIDETVIAGWPDDDRYGDQQFVQNLPCQYASSQDSISGSEPGATWYLGGTSSIHVDKGKLEILRRRQGNSLVSVHALDSSGAGYTASTLSWNDEIITTKSGSPSQDMVVHGLAWAPRAQMTFGNVTNVANGQLLGGAVFSRIDLQASASASGFIIRVESSPIPVTLYLDAKATKNNASTTMRAVVQISDDGIETAVNSWRVLDS